MTRLKLHSLASNNGLGWRKGKIYIGNRMKKAVFISAVLGLCQASFCQLDYADLQEGSQLDTIYYYNVKTGKEGEFKAALAFKFKDVVNQYYHTQKDNRLMLEFYDASMAQKPLPEIGLPFADIKVSTRKDNVQLQEDLTPKLRPIVRFEMELPEDVQYHYTVEGGQRLITLTVLWSRGGMTSVQLRETKRKIIKYSVAGVIVAGIVGGIVWIVLSTPEDSDTDQIHVKQ